jgi:uncharacterized membrane protein
MADMQALLILYVAGGLLLMALAVPLLRGKVRPNWFYGFRVPRTVNNPDIWYATNRFGAKRLLAAGASFVVSAIVFYFIPGITVDAYAWVCLAVFVTVFGVGLVQSIRFMNSLTEDQ